MQTSAVLTSSVFTPPLASEPLAALLQASELDERFHSAAESCRLLQERIAELTGEIEQLSSQCEDEHAARSEIELRMDTLLDVLPAGVVLIDTGGTVRQCNPAARALLGNRLLGRQWGRVIDQYFAPRQDDGHEVSLRDGRRVRVATASLAGGGGQLVLLTDLTETRSLQAQLSRHQRLQALGQMVSALAHQIRTPLAAAMLYASQLTQPLPADRQQQFAGKLLGRLHSMESQVRDMLLFVKGDVPLEDRLDADALLEAIAAALDPLVQAAGVELTYPDSIARGSNSLRCHRDGLVGAIANLANNAIQAGATRLQVHLQADGNPWQLSLCDNGPGMDAATLAQASEPFFTTRTCGTGLGLAIVNTVAQAHGGRLELSSQPGRGTCARLLLPVHNAGSHPAPVTRQHAHPHTNDHTNHHSNHHRSLMS